MQHAPTAPTVATTTEGNHPGFQLTYDGIATNCIAWDAPATATDGDSNSDGRSLEELLTAHAKLSNVRAAMKPGGYAYLATFEDVSYNPGDTRRSNAHSKAVTAAVAGTASCDPFLSGAKTFTVAVAINIAEAHALALRRAEALAGVGEYAGAAQKMRLIPGTRHRALGGIDAGEATGIGIDELVHQVTSIAGQVIESEDVALLVENGGQQVVVTKSTAIQGRGKRG